VKDLALHFIRRIRREPARLGAGPAERDRQISGLRRELAAEAETERDNPKGDG